MTVNATAPATKHRKFRNANCVQYEGSFTTADTAAPTVVKGEGFTVSAPSTGVYTVTFDRRFYDCIAKVASIDGATGHTQKAEITAHAAAPSTTNATITIETQSSAGTAANLTGPIVSFIVVWSETAVN
jgi:hypothetical protein